MKLFSVFGELIHIQSQVCIKTNLSSIRLLLERTLIYDALEREWKRRNYFWCDTDVLRNAAHYSWYVSTERERAFERSRRASEYNRLPKKDAESFFWRLLFIYCPRPLMASPMIYDVERFGLVMGFCFEPVLRCVSTWCEYGVEMESCECDLHWSGEYWLLWIMYFREDITLISLWNNIIDWIAC